MMMASECPGSEHGSSLSLVLLLGPLLYHNGRNVCEREKHLKLGFSDADTWFRERSFRCTSVDIRVICSERYCRISSRPAMSLHQMLFCFKVLGGCR